MCFGNKAWFKKFPCSNQSFLDKRGSDHRPVLIHLIEAQEKYKGCFRFDRRFLEIEGVEDIVANAWQFPETSGMRSISGRIKACRKALSTLKKQANVNSRDRIQQAEEALEREQSDISPSTDRINFLKRELRRAQKDEETYWWQKSRDKWLMRGDMNSAFFHNSVKAARAKKHIDKLMNNEGEEVFSEESKGEVAMQFYSDLFKSSSPPPFTSWFHEMHPRVTNQMNAELTKRVTPMEVREAVFSINPSKAPGPDGMSALFFQKFWSVIHEQVVGEVQRFFEKGILPREWNYTHLCLIPKVPEPKCISYLRPISLCSVIYKVISKIMAKRLAPMLQDIISPTQSAFVSDRLMTDNITIAHEMLHSLGDSKDPNSSKMVVKTDMSKAYDRVEWGYLRALLCALGFDLQWVAWIMKCVTTVTYSVLINDQPHGMIIPHRGLRQGDPLSPSLFVICSEGLTHLMAQADRERSISGIKFGENGTSVNQLMFADDCLFACEASEDQGANLIRNLKRYEGVTGQVINPAKSSIIFGHNVLEEDKIRVKLKLGIESEGGEGKYLGLPEVMKGSKVKLFAYLKERLSRKISGWHARTLSHGGKEVLLKAVASALPVLPMSVYRLPKTVLASLHSAMSNFWWDNDEFRRKIHWISWEKLCLAKEDGGMGFKDLECFNQALLAKQAWRVIQCEECLLAKLLKAKYYQHESFFQVQQRRNDSYAWKSILHGRELLMKGLKRGVGNGRSLKVWTEPWVEDEEGLCRPPLGEKDFLMSI